MSGFRDFSDFSNIVKAFIGASYLSMPYAMDRAGIVLLLLLILVVLILNDHCCQLIIRCKHKLVNKLVEMAEHPDAEVNDDLRSMYESYRRSLNSYITYTDVGLLSFGVPGKVVVEVFLLITQFLFCVNYVNFIGNTFNELLPERTIISNQTADSGSTGSHVRKCLQPEHIGPGVDILMLCTFPIFFGFVLIRKVRHISPISLIANLSLLTGFGSLFGYFLINFQYGNSHSLFKFATFPVAFGQIANAFEGIGLIIPLEASMVENNSLFPCFLHLTLILVTSLYSLFSLLVYFRLGDGHVPQIINKSLGRNPFAYGINICLMIAIICTFPLQFFPVIEITESYLFLPGRICGPAVASGPDANNAEDAPLLQEVMDHDGHLQINNANNEESQSTVRLTSSAAHFQGSANIPGEVAAWKRNLVRISLLVVCVGIAIPLKDSFAYVAALTGALGSIPMAYTLPCLFHLKIFWDDYGVVVKTKDIAIIIFGIVSTVACVCISIVDMVRDLSTKNKGCYQ